MSLPLPINPEIPIPSVVSALHGISDRDVKDAPKFKEIANKLVNFIGNSDLAGYNSNKFDIPILAEEFLRAESDFDFEVAVGSKAITKVVR